MSPIPDYSLAPLLTLSQASKLLNVSIRQIYRLIADGKIPVIMVGKRSPRLRPGDIQHYLESCTIQHGI
jgi:excisionase family DNA binding protein